MRRVRHREYRQEFVSRSRVHPPLPQDRRLERQLRLHGQQFLRVRRCRQAAIAAQFRVPFQEVIAPAARVRDSRCARRPGKVADRLRHVQVVGAKVAREVPVDLAGKVDHGRKDPEQFPRDRGRVRALLDVRGCCHRFQTRCRRKRSLASRCIHADRRSANGRWSTSARWKVSGSCTPRVSVLEQGAEERQPWRQRHRSRVRRAM